MGFKPRSSGAFFLPNTERLPHVPMQAGRDLGRVDVPMRAPRRDEVLKHLQQRHALQLVRVRRSIEETVVRPCVGCTGPSFESAFRDRFQRPRPSFLPFE